jgi:hypothetical protein
MWITQTYLGNVEPNANLFAYYFFLDYDSEQKRFTEHLQRELEKLGDIYGDQVSLLMPNKRYAGRIEAEVREYRKLWEAVYDELPGVFLSKKPLVQLSPEDNEFVFISFKDQDAKQVAATIREIRGIADDTLAHNFSDKQSPPKPSFVRRLADSIEVKPGIWGIQIDLRKFLSR